MYFDAGHIWIDAPPGMITELIRWCVEGVWLTEDVFVTGAGWHLSLRCALIEYF